MKNFKLQNHFLSALAVIFFLFITFGCDDSKPTGNSGITTDIPQQEPSSQSKPIKQEPTPETKPNNDEKISEQKSLYINNLKRCVEIANEISKTDNDTLIENLKQEGINCQAKAVNAFLALQDPELNFPYDKIKSMRTVNPIFFGIWGPYSDERIQKLPPAEYKVKIQEQLEKFNSTITDLDNF